MQDGCEFLVAQTPDGRMDLRDVYVLDQDGGVYARPETTGEMPQEPQMYVAVPWRQEFLGDLSHNKDPWTKVRWTGLHLDGGKNGTADGWEEEYTVTS